MKELLSIHDYLVSPDTMNYWEDDAIEAADKFNYIMHTTYECVPDDISVIHLEKLLISISEFWLHDDELLNIDDEEIEDWIRQRILQAETEGLEDDDESNNELQDY